MRKDVLKSICSKRSLLQYCFQQACKYPCTFCIVL